MKNRGTTSNLKLSPLAAFYFKKEVVLAAHPPSCHPWRVFGNQERERKRREKRENWKENEKLRVCTERLKVASGYKTMGVYIGHPMCETTRKPKILAHTRDKEVIHQNGVVWH